MNQARYWMWTNRKPGLSSNNLQPSTKASYDDSWEEQAFAEDTAGSLGGCIWPPRSYSCSFCGREFTSAQALGGHMNVHRRDRARLKQSPTSHDEILHHDPQNSPNHIQKPFLPVSFQYQPDEVCNFVYNPNPNSNHGTPPSPPSNSKDNCPEPTLVPALSSETAQGHSMKSPKTSTKSWSNFVEDRYYHFSDLWNEGEKCPSILESGCSVKADYVQTDLSVCLNLIVRRGRTPPTTSGSKEEIGCKRKRTDHTPFLPFLLKPISIETHHLQAAEVSELSPSSDDDIDLELRLGPSTTHTHLCME
ncbi:hypothetical protein V6Z12_A04G113100 [Gossypium hirsutum]